MADSLFINGCESPCIYAHVYQFLLSPLKRQAFHAAKHGVEGKIGAFQLQVELHYRPRCNSGGVANRNRNSYIA
ncbi:hypothetical protein DSECCO2_589480 [anaerobic digester metagenome]